MLAEQPCPQQTCGCFIGYVQLDRLDFRRRFGDGLAARMLLGQFYGGDTG